jgi:hypothetical protein
MTCAPEALPVVICNLSGEFLACLGYEWDFTPDRSRAHVFDYHTDDVAAQQRLAWRQHGVGLIVLPVDPQLATEKCDDCNRILLRSADAYFDGFRFCCSSCMPHPS